MPQPDPTATPPVETPVHTGPFAVAFAVFRESLPILGIALLIVGLAEVGARAVLRDDPTWTYWNRTMASKVRFIERQADRGRTPDALVLGDSSAAFNVIPKVLDEGSDRLTFNLGSAGNYARSFDLVMRQHVLDELPDPDTYIVSFAGRGFLPESAGQSARILSSPIGQRLQGNRVWGDWLWLVRVHHLLRLYRDPEPAPSVFRNRGFEPYLIALKRRARRPGLAKRLPPPPRLLVRPDPPRPTLDEDPMQPLRNLFARAQAKDIRVVLLSPPYDPLEDGEEPVHIDTVAAVCAEWGVPHLDYTDLPLKSHNYHLDVKGARRYTARLRRDLEQLEAEGWAPPEAPESPE